MNILNGTPATLSEAIQNGLTRSHAVGLIIEVTDTTVNDVQEHVVDFIRNKLCSVTMSPDPSERATAKLIQELLGI